MGNHARETGDAAAKPPAVRVDDVTEVEWYNRLEQFGDASFYQTWAYGAVSWGDSQLSHLVLEPADGPAGLAQVRVVTLPVLRAGVAYVRWGPCAQRRGAPWDPDAWRQSLGALVAEYADRRGLLLRVIPNVYEEDDHAGAALEILREHGLERDAAIPAYRTIRVDLAPDPEAIRKRFDGKWRNQLNAAERRDLTVTEGTGDDLFGQFVDLYDEMMSRKQFETSVDVRAFRRIQQRLPDASKMLVLIAASNGVAQAGLVATAVSETGIYLLGATTSEGMKNKGSYLLQWQMMCRLRTVGCRWYDLGGINPETNPGVYHFKNGMGGIECRQLGRFSRGGSRLSTAAVHAAERFATWARRARRCRHSSAPVRSDA